ncbi:MAG: GerAB/ArcD/ProY family transporter [Eubacteriales bacterium]|nr:GerAB/ArcD/ProY family transporter [Eubacteriales bacterium]
MNQVNDRQATCLLLVILSGWALTMTAENGRDGWIVVLLASLLILPVAALCCLPSEQLPCTRWYALPDAVFGKGFGTAYLCALTVLAFWSLCMTVLSGVIFLRTVSGGQWYVWLLTVAILLCAAAAAQNGVTRLVLWTEPVVWLVIAALAISLLLSLRQMDWNALFPVMENGWQGTPMRVYLLLSIPFGEVFFAAAALGGTGTQTRVGLLRACILAGVLLCLLYIRNICLLGPDGANAVLYPSYTAASVLEFGKSFQRGEALISGSLIVCTVARAALLLDFLSGCSQAVTARCTQKRGVWLFAVIAGILCSLCAGSNDAFANAQQLYQLLLLPFVLIAAAALAIGVMVKKKSR